MKTAILTLFSAFLIVGCSGSSGSRSAATAPVIASFAAGSADTIEVQITDREPATQVELVAPDGRVYPAYQILRDRTVETGGGAGPSVGFGLGVGSGWGHGSGSGVSTGVGFGFPLGGGGYRREPSVRTTARIAVDDMAAYRASWQAWKVRMTMGEANRVIETGAPPPPA